MKAHEQLRAQLAGVNLSALHRVMGSESVSLRTLSRIRNGKVSRVSVDTAADIQRGLKALPAAAATEARP